MNFTLLFTVLFLSLTSFAFEDGTYTCGSRTDFFEVTYKVKTLTVDGISLPHLDITKSFYKQPTDPTSKDRTFNIKGIATLFINDEGQEGLGLGNVIVDLTAGRIVCK